MTCLLCPSEVSASGGSSGKLDHEATNSENLINALCQFLLLPLDPWSFTLNGRNANQFLTSYCAACVDRMKQVHALWKQFEEIQLQIITLRRDVEQKLIQADLVSNNQIRKQLINALNLSQLGILQNGLTSDFIPSEIIKVENEVSTGESGSQFGNQEAFSFAENWNEKQFEVTTIIDPTELQSVQSDNVHDNDNDYEIPSLTSNELQSENTSYQDEVQDNDPNADDPMWTPSSSDQDLESDDNHENSHISISKSHLPIRRQRNKPFTPISPELKAKLIDEIESTKRILQVKMKHVRWDEDSCRWIVPRFRQCPLRPSKGKKDNSKLKKPKKLSRLKPKPPEPDPNIKRRKRKYRLLKECNEVFHCAECSLKFDTARRRDAHVLRKHKGDRLPFKCKHCGKGFNVDYSCLIHERRCHTGEKPYKCERCEKGFFTDERLQVHVAMVHEKSMTASPNPDRNIQRRKRKYRLVKECDEVFQCPECSFSFDTARRRDAHVLRKHKGDRLPFKCQHCGEGFNVDSKCLIHEIRRHTGEIPYKCEQCEKGFFTNESLQVHIAVVHEKNVSSLSESLSKPIKVCAICGKVIYGTNSLKIHMKLHLNQKDFCCEQCGVAFYRKPDLTKHLIKHHPNIYDVSNNPEYRCKFCNKLFHDKLYVRRHEKLHVGQDIPFSCSICEYKCFGKSRFDIHMARHENKRDYKCMQPGCTRTDGFNTIFLLRKHQRAVHEILRPHQCSYCEKKFKETNALRCHEALHKNLKNIKCPVCGEGFALRKYMLRCVDKHKKDGSLPEGFGDVRIRPTKYEFKPTLIRKIISTDDAS